MHNRQRRKLLYTLHRRLNPVANRLHAQAKTRRNKALVRRKQKSLKKTLYAVLQTSPPDLVGQMLDVLADETVVVDLLEAVIL